MQIDIDQTTYIEQEIKEITSHSSKGTAYSLYSCVILFISRDISVAFSFAFCARVSSATMFLVGNGSFEGEVSHVPKVSTLDAIHSNSSLIFI